MAKKQIKDQFRFRKHETIGAEAAEDDSDMLDKCFVDTGDLSVLLDVKNPKRIVLGRTGTGKSAMLMHLHQTVGDQHAAWVEPEELSLQFLSNSSIIKTLNDLGVNLDIFYNLLWRHVFTVELIKLRYHIHNENEQNVFLKKIQELLARDRGKQEAFNYLRQWGDRFWEDTENRVHEVTETLEKNIHAGLSAELCGAGGDLGSISKATIEEKKVIAHRLQEIVNGVQIQKMAKIIDTLKKDVFSDPKQRFYVLVDRLDDDWVEDKIRYDLIKALIETVRYFNRITNAKIIIAIRRDLLDRVVRETRSPLFQEEKFLSLYLRMNWTKSQLSELVERRVGELVRRRYTKTPVKLLDILPAKIDKKQAMDWITERSFFRPRDVLQFINCLIDQSVGKGNFSVSGMRLAEAAYSKLRFRSVADEWSADYPELGSLVDILPRRSKTFKVGEIEEAVVGDFCLSLVVNPQRRQGRISKIAAELAEGRTIGYQEALFEYIRIMYDVGFIGVKRRSNDAVSWSFNDVDALRQADITEEAIGVVCPMFYRVLGVNSNNGAD